MVDDRENLDADDKKEDSFEFDSAGEAIEYISLDQARLVAVQAARETPGNYGRTYEEVRMVLRPCRAGRDGRLLCGNAVIPS